MCVSTSSMLGGGIGAKAVEKATGGAVPLSSVSEKVVDKTKDTLKSSRKAAVGLAPNLLEDV